MIDLHISWNYSSLVVHVGLLLRWHTLACAEKFPDIELILIYPLNYIQLTSRWPVPRNTWNYRRYGYLGTRVRFIREIAVNSSDLYI